MKEEAHFLKQKMLERRNPNYFKWGWTTSNLQPAGIVAVCQQVWGPTTYKQDPYTGMQMDVGVKEAQICHTFKSKSASMERQQCLRIRG